MPTALACLAADSNLEQLRYDCNQLTSALLSYALTCVQNSEFT
jgi:hypothetical protein